MTLLHRISGCGITLAAITVATLVAAPLRAASERQEQLCSLGPCLPPHPTPPTVHDGRFSVGYQQIYCKRAPCPAGGLAIFFADRPPIRVKTIAFAPGTPRNLQPAYQWDDPRRRYVVFEGSVTIAFDKSIAVIRPLTAAYSQSAKPPSSPFGPKR
ncbi:hypothetical protein G4G27_06580 [Sphingomonas sp. So64.6b]|uniref:hypothetical protein n=1 Tax=Sphingomonas sp. So64.6b TaxID=2997354 RepID=UPI0016007481|nr:hypothetical protein [Sphingomonas sp. So64.6b]QNA83697.1 hypothetical protein G4G27_06580 [Sphingomonas sp. So64.6b]